MAGWRKDRLHAVPPEEEARNGGSENCGERDDGFNIPNFG